MDTFFVVTAPGLDAITADEIRQLGLSPLMEPGGVTFRANWVDMYRANLYLRTASRIVARVGQFFYATAFAELRDKASRLPWERFLAPGRPVTIRVTCHKSKLIHTDAVAERIAGAIYDRLGKESPLMKPGNEDSANNSQLVVVRVAKDQVTVSVDSSGELLHRRGYRLAVAKAPLRETLAAGMLLACGWDLKSPLMDPFCGSGTIPIESALMALGIPAGINRSFAFMDWPDFKELEWKALLENVHPMKVIDFPILASDRDAGAVKMAQQNAERAGVDAYIKFSCQAVSALQAPANVGWVVTNPPYGLRIGDGKDLRNLYAQFGNVLRAQCRGWKVAVLSSDLMLLGQLGMNLDSSLALVNGGLGVRLGRGQVILNDELEKK